MPRVLHVLHSMNCGGAETLLMNLLRGADPAELRFDFLVHVPDEMFYEAELKARGAVIHRLPSLRQLGPMGYRRALARFFREHPEVRIVHSHLETTTGLILEQARRAGVPLRLAHSHNTRFTRAGLRAIPENTLKRWCRRKIVPNATHRLACSPEAARWLFGNTEAILLPNAIDTARFRFSERARQETRERLGIPRDARVLLHVGRFQPQKNHRFLMRIWQEYAALKPSAYLICVGEGELMPEIKALADTLPGAARVRFAGLQAETAAFYSAADVFLLPSLFEGLPVTLVEAQAAGLPCLISERVPSDTLRNLRRLPLNDTALWLDALRQKNIMNNCALRIAHYELINDAGYGIQSALEKLLKIYEAENDEGEHQP